MIKSEGGITIMILSEKTILVTGGTGSFGQKFAEIALKEGNTKAIRIFSRGELLQEEMRRRFGDDKKLRFFIGDVRDRERVFRAMNGVDIVVHAAALKQVPACEYNPIEAIRTNVDGAINVIDAAIDNGVEKVIAISTDKAAYPVNLYGATKLVAEKLFTQANVYAGFRKTIFSCVRYGNVMGSRGSVIPLFIEQRGAGEITVTDERMTRYWISLEQGIRFVIRCMEIMCGGEIFIPKLPSVRITDLADVTAPGAKRKVIGIRAGEKLHEALITAEEARHAREFDNFFVVDPEFVYWGKEHLKDGQALPENFTYTSDTNNWCLSPGELKKIVQEFEDE